MCRRSRLTDRWAFILSTRSLYFGLSSVVHLRGWEIKHCFIKFLLKICLSLIEESDSHSPSVHQYTQLSASFWSIPVCMESYWGDLVPTWRGSEEAGETDWCLVSEIVLRPCWPSHQTQSSSGSPVRLGCQHNIMSFFKTSSSRHGLGQIVHLANKDLIIISVVIRIKWTEEKLPVG